MRTLVLILCLAGLLLVGMASLGIGAHTATTPPTSASMNTASINTSSAQQAGRYAPQPSYSVIGFPTISATFINRVLSAYHSPAAGKGKALFALGVKYGIDPAFALAFFMHESSFGTAGEARSSLSLGNIRCLPKVKCQDGYAWFTTWEAGFEAWYSLIRNLYVAAWGLTTVEQIIPKYAPASDSNNEAAYIGKVEQAIDAWRAGRVLV